MSGFVLGGAIRNLPISALRAPMGPSLLLGAPGEDRTRGLLIRSETLYPLSYERIYEVLKTLQLLSFVFLNSSCVSHFVNNRVSDFFRHSNYFTLP